MKQSFSLIEVLISVALLSVVITAIFQIKENNLFFLSKFANSAKNNELLSLATIEKIDTNNLRNTNIYLDKIVDFKDDDIAKRFKNIKVNIKDTEDKDLDLSIDEYNLKIQIFKSHYKIDSKAQTDIYSFKLGY